MNAAETLFGALRMVLETGLLLAVSAALVWALTSRAARTALGLTRSAPLLKLARALLVAALLLPAAARLAPRERLLEPRLVASRAALAVGGTRLWLAPAARDFSIGAPAPRRQFPLDARALGFLLAALVVCAARLAALRAREALRLTRWVRQQPIIRRLGKTAVRATSHGGVPASARVPGEAAILLPVEWLATPSAARIAVLHELQHHRQGDTRWAYVLEALSCAFFWNPAATLWARILNTLQELACDEALVGRRGVTPQAYGRCLLRAAELAVGPPAHLSLGMAVGSSGIFLRRRIEMLFIHKGRKTAEATVLGFVALSMVSLMGGLAFAARSAIQDHSLTLTELQARVSPTDPLSEIPLVINDQVLKELNRYLSTEEGRDEIRHAFARMPQYRDLIEHRLKEYGLPRDLEIVPLVEAGYINYFNPHHQRGAGLWGFIPQTARRYDLHVDELGNPDRVDDRLDEDRETVAAAKYFRDLHTLFQDWRLALKGYNEGEAKVSREIMDSGTRDAWELERQFESKERYLAKITAALLIYKNPGLLD